MTAPSAANRFGLDYVQEAQRLGPPCVEIIDAHTHIGGPQAARIFGKVMDLFGIKEVWSMTPLEDVPTIRDALDGRFRPIAIPDFNAQDIAYASGEGYRKRLPLFHAHGARLAKFWAAPRAIDIAEERGAKGLLQLDHPTRLETMQAAVDLGMGIMVHVADPDTWFQTMYRNSDRYGTKRQQYDRLEVVLDRFHDVPLLAAHMGGWPEDLEFLDGLMERHEQLHLDTSATKWMVRELSRHSQDEFLTFFNRYSDRILFGSDNVTMEQHLGTSESSGIRNAISTKANSPEGAFDLYASRYFALRTLLETDTTCESPIADPDLAMVHPETHSELHAPQLVGKALPESILRKIYNQSHHDLMRRIDARAGL